MKPLPSGFFTYASLNFSNLVSGFAWLLVDPAGKGIDDVRPIRDAIRAKVEALIAEIDAN